MKPQMKNILLISALIVLFPILAAAQGSAFNFQGRLNDGANPANGSYDLQFRLYNALTGGTQIGSTVLRPNTTLINGVFSVTLDFGATAFNNPNSIFIEIGVKPNGSPNAFTILGPRQQLTVVPFAVRADSAANADNANTLEGYNSLNFIRNSAFPQAGADFNIGGVGTIGTRLVVNGDSVVSGTQSAAQLNAGTTTISGPTRINNSLNVTGSSIVGGEVVVGSNLRVAGTTLAGGDALQSRDKSGYPKVLLRVNSNGTIANCHNGIFGNPPPACGFAVTRLSPGLYKVGFTFQVSDRFVLVNLGVSSPFLGVTLRSSPNNDELIVNTFSVDGNQTSDADIGFMVIIY